MFFFFSLNPLLTVCYIACRFGPERAYLGDDGSAPHGDGGSTDDNDNGDDDNGDPPTRTCERQRQRRRRRDAWAMTTAVASDAWVTAAAAVASDMWAVAAVAAATTLGPRYL